MQLNQSLKRHSLNFVFFVIIPILLFTIFIKTTERTNRLYKEEQQITCPSLLSIARSARDTLIVMRDKSMCTEYMLENLK